jgi:hypothetical protein
MTIPAETAEPRPPKAAPSRPAEDDERYRRALLAALRVAHARVKLCLLEIEDIGAELKAGRLTPAEAMRLCVTSRIESLFPRESDGA